MKNEKQKRLLSDEDSLLYFTSDQLSFLDETSALKHARKLTDKAIVTMTKRESETELEAISNDAGNTGIDALLDELTGVQ